MPKEAAGLLETLHAEEGNPPRARAAASKDFHVVSLSLPNTEALRLARVAKAFAEAKVILEEAPVEVTMICPEDGDLDAVATVVYPNLKQALTYPLSTWVRAAAKEGEGDLPPTSNRVSMAFSLAAVAATTVTWVVQAHRLGVSLVVTEKALALSKGSLFTGLQARLWPVGGTFTVLPRRRRAKAEAKAGDWAALASILHAFILAALRPTSSKTGSVIPALEEVPDERKATSICRALTLAYHKTKHSAFPFLIRMVKGKASVLKEEALWSEAFQRMERVPKEYTLLYRMPPPPEVTEGDDGVTRFIV